MQEVPDNSAFVVSKDQVWCDLAGEAAILNLKNGVYYGLDPVGARVWQLMQQPATLADLCTAIQAEYDVAPEQCRTDLKNLLNELVLNQLVELRDDAAAA